MLPSGAQSTQAQIPQPSAQNLSRAEIQGEIAKMQAPLDAKLDQIQDLLKNFTPRQQNVSGNESGPSFLNDLFCSKDLPPDKVIDPSSFSSL